MLILSIKNRQTLSRMNRQINANRIYTENDVKTCLKCKKQNLYT